MLPLAVGVVGAGGGVDSSGVLTGSPSLKGSNRSSNSAEGVVGAGSRTDSCGVGSCGSLRCPGGSIGNGSGGVGGQEGVITMGVVGAQGRGYTRGVSVSLGKDGSHYGAEDKL